jgi:hypothetical protein
MISVFLSFELSELRSLVHDGFGDDCPAGRADEVAVFAV